jgi:quinol monooxygenase YgiN
MIIVAGHLDFVTQQGRDGAVMAAVDLQQSTRHDEPGCLAYSFAADSAVPTRVQVYELWSDAASLEAHFQHPNYTAMRALLRSFERAGASVAKYRCDATAPIYNADGVATASFGS